jgi:uncharacterized iron-regulated membrane protein
MNVTMTTAQSNPAGDGGLYRRVWRWHFFASLICLPLIVSLAVTGAMYLFHRQIDDVVYGDLLLRPAVAVGQAVGAGAVPALAPERLLQVAVQAYPGRAKSLTLPADARHSAQVDVAQAGGTLQVFVDPATGKVLGAVAESRRLMGIVKQLHSLALVGEGGQAVIEVVAGWIILLVLSGAYLWWPRGRRQGVLAIRAGASGRAWWRDLHAVTGAYAAVVILFLALTGMPWSVVWGQNVNRWLSEHGLGVPDGMWRNVPKSTLPAAALGDLPWNLQQQAVPASSAPSAGNLQAAERAEDSADDPHAAHRAAAAAAATPYQVLGNPAIVGPGRIVALLREAGMADGYRLMLPRDASGVYSAVLNIGRLDDQRVMHLDQYSGKVLMDIGADRLGAVGRVTEWGVSVHQGLEYGWPNLLLMLSGCLALIGLCVSGVAMWWKRRPAGRLGVPPSRADDRLARGAVAIAAVAGVIFPLLGASLVLVGLADWLLGRRRALA